MAPLSRTQLLDLCLHRYFDRIDAKDLDPALACFHDTAHFTVQTAFVRHDGKPAIRRMFQDFMAHYAVIRHYNYDSCVDVKEQRVSSIFDVELVDHAGARTALRSTNFWRIREGLFQEVFVYTSGMNPLT